ncbi:MAG TPA: AAA family ATPase [Candidatus Dormibacteraeota bacterium]|nr:AAA family ATPase [Candidatus Dormibacteraeota bacterium]
MALPSRRAFVGRSGPLARVAAAVEAASAGRAGLVLVSGEAGIGKTSLVAEALLGAGELRLGWGTCWDDRGAPGYWPWTQALGALAADACNHPDAVEVAESDRGLLAALMPSLGSASVPSGDEEARLRLFDAVGRWLVAAGRGRPVAIVLDDLHWADRSSLDLLDFLVRSRPAARLLLVGAFRPDEVPIPLRATIAGLTSRADTIRLGGLDAGEVGELVAHVAGGAGAERWAAEVFRRSEGHPLFTRELAHDLRDGFGDRVPRAVLDLVRARLDRLAPATVEVLCAAALLGNEPRPDVVASALGAKRQAIEGAVREAAQYGILEGVPDRPRFAHDVFREAVVESLEPAAARALHLRIATALEARHVAVAPQEVSRHLTASVPLATPAACLVWASAAARAEQAALALAEAAAHLTRLREALVDADVAVDGATWVDLLVAEADALARAGQRDTARGLLTLARTRAAGDADPSRLAAVAFGVQRLGARFATPRRDVIDVLDEARRASAGGDVALTARLTAAMARELHHSVPEDRPRAVPLSAEALALARQSADPGALAAAALARHDVLWSPGTGAERIELAREIAALAEGTGDAELHAEGLLLTANALLETGSSAFRPALRRYLEAVEALGQPRHRYYALTRRAALALLDDRLDEAAETIDRAARLGDEIGEPDAGNVRMSQLLELTRARGDREEQLGFAARAVRWWTGAPVHAHAVAAGFHARGGDLDAARHDVDTVLDLGGWNGDRSYLWSVYVANLADAAHALGDADLARLLLVDLQPLGDSCGVNGAVVAFAGCHAHAAAVAAQALGDVEAAGLLLARAARVYSRIGARGWERAACDAHRDLTARARNDRPSNRRRLAVLRRGDRTWSITLDGQGGATTATVPDLKGWRDLAALLRRPGTDVHVLELIGAGAGGGSRVELADATAIAQYRTRLLDVEEERLEAESAHDAGRLERLDAEREAVLAELQRVTGIGGRARRDGADATERARKAVSARVHDAISRLEPVLPEVAARLRRSVVTGAWCRYRGEDDVEWRVEDR